jgi:hypothetical protein
MVGAGLMAVALAMSATALGGSGFDLRWLVIGPVLGLGIGLCYPVLAGAAVHGLPAADLAAATAINQCARQLGAALGVATAVGVLGREPVPDLGHFHAAWLVGASFCVAAVAAGSWIPHSRTGSRSAAPSVATVPTPIATPVATSIATSEERSA